eukprot:1177438-Prorocentrum_minimum.AAC.5
MDHKVWVQRGSRGVCRRRARASALANRKTGVGVAQRARREHVPVGESHVSQGGSEGDLSVKSRRQARLRTRLKAKNTRGFFRARCTYSTRGAQTSKTRVLPSLRTPRIPRSRGLEGIYRSSLDATLASEPD